MFTTTLLDWFALNGRDLPWRRTRDPYRIWLSEVILQQTRIAQGMEYYLQFVSKWPTVERLAEATEDEVMKAWQGLGYYSRARHLHETAKAVTALGGFPSTIEGLRALKGVGDYTAAAIGSIAFGLPSAVVDGNVYRVLARHFGVETPINSTEGKKLFRELAQSLLPEDRPAEFNQAMMDFGAMQCLPSSPDCMECTLQETCEAFRTNRVGSLPVKLKKVEVKTRRLIYIYIRWEGMTAIRKRPAGDIWQGLWEPMNVAEDAIPQGAKMVCRDVKHVLTHRILLADFYLWETEREPDLPEGYIWVKEEDLDQYAVPRLIEILLEKLPRG